MKSTLSDNKQLFNIKAIAAEGLIPDAIPEGQFGIVNEDTNLTVSPLNFDALPTNFRFISKLGGKVYYSFNTINKNRISRRQAKLYQSEQINIWKVTSTHCDCTKGVRLNINIDEDSLNRRDGITWAHSDFIVDVSPKELTCFCDCSGKTTYDNNVITKLLYERVQALNSPFYEAEVQDESGNVFADAAAIQTFIDANKAVNTDNIETNEGEKLVLFIKGKLQTAGIYADLDVNYVYPRGVKLNPFLTINEDVTLAFEEVQPLRYEIGAGYDIRAEERECMSLYTNLNYYPQLSDGIAHPNLVYQFENNKNYDTFSFEFGVDKSGLGISDDGKKQFGVLLVSEQGNNIHATLLNIFNS